jgi:hypothetical protein
MYPVIAVIGLLLVMGYYAPRADQQQSAFQFANGMR